MSKAVCLVVTLALGFGLPLIGSSAEQHDQHMQHVTPAPEAASPVIKLSPDLQQLLKDEMNAVQMGMQDMLPLIAAGEWPQLAKIAANIQQTFIMQQQLSPEQMSQLHQALPAEFIDLDQNFHRMAGMLAQVSEARHQELVTFYYYKLAESCMDCHSHFATHRFPAFARPAMDQGHQH